MRKLLFATAAAAAITATPAVPGTARLMSASKAEFCSLKTRISRRSHPHRHDQFSGRPHTNVGEVRFHDGYDVDAIGGYDFGLFRLEGELGYKHASVERVNINQPSSAQSTRRQATLSPSAISTSVAMPRSSVRDGQRSCRHWADGRAWILCRRRRRLCRRSRIGRSTGKFAWQAIAGLTRPSAKYRCRHQVPVFRRRTG